MIKEGGVPVGDTEAMAYILATIAILDNVFKFSSELFQELENESSWDESLAILQRTRIKEGKWNVE